MMKKLYISLLAMALASMAATAQDNLNKEIVLDKDFVPVVKKVAKKSALPQVLKPVKATNTKNEINYSNWAEPTAVGTEIPTMLPYGYRTGHNFSSQRGYLAVGAGSQFNLTGSAGYRVIDDSTLTVNAWAQHCSTWNGANSSPVFKSDPLRHKFNDNTLGVDVASRAKAGTLGVNARLHLDNFNYYGAFKELGESWNANNNQKFTEAQISAGWQGRLKASEYHDITYLVGLQYGYGAYSKFYEKSDDKGARECHLQALLGAQYAISASSDVGLHLKFNHINRKFLGYDLIESAYVWTSLDDKASMITANPFVAYRGQNLTARLGAEVCYSFDDGAKLRIAPQAQVAYEVSPGLSLFADVQGGKHFNTLARMHTLMRYANPNQCFESTFSPVDGEAGVKIGPFSGFSAKAYVGYGIFRNDQMASQAMTITTNSDGVQEKALHLGVVNFDSYNTKGVKVGAEFNYKYRSLADFTLKGVYAPQDETITYGKDYTGYALGVDRPEYIVGANLAVYPIKNLTIDAGFELRGNRKNILRTGYDIPDATNITAEFVKLSDATNLQLGGSYQFTRALSLWIRANNVLNKQWDSLYGLGAQKFSVMGGVQLVF